MIAYKILKFCSIYIMLVEKSLSTLYYAKILNGGFDVSKMNACHTER